MDKEVIDLQKFILARELFYSEQNQYGPGSLGIDDMLKFVAEEIIKAGYTRETSIHKDKDVHAWFSDRGYDDAEIRMIIDGMDACGYTRELRGGYG